MTRSLPAVLAAALLLAALPAAAATTFRVTVPSATPAADTVFIAGDFQGWNPGDPASALTRQPDGRWTITLELAGGQPIQFKFTRGSWARVEKGENGEEIANRTFTPNGDETVDLTVARWADLGTITGHVELFSTPAFLGGRTCRVYLPPGYFSATRRYPVLYMHDAQNLFDVRTSFAGEWQVDEAAEGLIRGGELDPFIVVGIDNSAARCAEYTPWPDPTAPCGGGGGDAYLASIRDVLIPAINARYRTLTGPDHTWMSGSSLGGLISAYAGYAYGDVFGRVAAVSPSYWWAARTMLTYAGLHGRPAVTRFYHDIGLAEPASAVQNLRDMRAILLSQGFVEGVDFEHVEAPGHGHNEPSWAARMPDVLRFIANPAQVAGVAPPAPGAAIALAVGPNPARSGARIALTLPRGGEARVEILDLRGARVRTLHAGALAAGAHGFRWDGRDAGGRRAAAGLYLVAATGAGARASRTLVVLP